jgi:membrane-associated phospholipid phosphatase
MTVYIDYFLNIFSYGPLFLIILSWYLLWNKNTLFFYYTVGLFLDTILNLVVKGLFKQSRPSEDPQKFNLAITHGKRFLFKDGMPYDIFGMPSGHSQSVLFSTIFMYFALKDKKIIYIYLIISLLTITQRIYSYNHTLFQTIVGAFIGSLVGYLMFFLSGQKLTGIITEKLDDFGPV